MKITNSPALYRRGLAIDNKNEGTHDCRSTTTASSSKVRLRSIPVFIIYFTTTNDIDWVFSAAVVLFHTCWFDSLLFYLPVFNRFLPIDNHILHALLKLLVLAKHKPRHDKQDSPVLVVVRSTSRRNDLFLEETVNNIGQTEGVY